MQKIDPTPADRLYSIGALLLSAGLGVGTFAAQVARAQSLGISVALGLSAFMAVMGMLMCAWAAWPQEEQCFIDSQPCSQSEAEAAQT